MGRWMDFFRKRFCREIVCLGMNIESPWCFICPLHFITILLFTESNALKRYIGKPNLNLKVIEYTERTARLLFCFSFHSFLLVSGLNRWRAAWTFQCAPIDLINSFFTLHWLWIHRSNSHYISNPARGCGDAQLCSQLTPAFCHTAAVVDLMQQDAK